MTGPRYAPTVPRPVGVLVVASLAILSLASMILFFADPPSGLLALGPAAVDKQIGDELAILLDTAWIEASQRLIHVTGLALFIGVGGFVITRRPGSRHAATAAITLAALGAALFAPLELLPGGQVISRVVGATTAQALPYFWGSVAGLATLAFLAGFPDGVWTPAWSRWLVVVPAGVGIVALIFPESIVDPGSWSSEIRVAWILGIPVLGLVAHIARRRANPLPESTRPVTTSLFIAMGTLVALWLLQPRLSPGVLDLIVVTPRLRAAYALNALVLLTMAVFAFPISVPVAVFRHRLFEFDVIVNRALVYGVVTGLVGVGFLALITVAALIAGVPLRSAIEGSGAGPLGVAFGTCLVLAFQPLRSRVQRIVDRRFYRQKYDTQRVIDGFSETASKLVDPGQVEAELLATVAQTLEPTTSRLLAEPFEPGLRHILESGENVETTANGVRPVYVPLFAGGSVSRVLELGPRSSQTRYSTLDLELLDRLARAAGPALELAQAIRVREREAEERERASHELELARKIQQGLLPRTYPDIEGWSFDAKYLPARQVGGDFYDWVPLDDGRLAVVIGDVSDKGIPAALVMATCRTLLRVAVTTADTPGEVLATVNDRLEPDIPPEMFVTCLLALLDPKDGTLEVANAGHNLPLHRTEAGAREVMVRGMPLGLLPAMSYEMISIGLDCGDDLVLTSDGLAEAHGPDHMMYGTERLRQVVGDVTEAPIPAVLADHLAFVGDDWQQEDDITIVTVGRASPIGS